MIKVLRDNIRRLAWVLWLVIIAFIAIVFTEFGGPPTQAGDPNEAAATVGNQKVTFGEFQSAYQNLERQYRQSFGDQFTSEQARAMGLPRMALDQLITTKILLAEATKLGIEPSVEDVREAILEYPVFQNETGGFVGDEEYRRILRSNGLTIADFEAQVRNDLARIKLNQILQDSVYVSEEEVEREAREEAEKADIRYLKLDGASLADQVEVTDEEIQTWYEEHRSDYQRAERRRVAWLAVNVNTVRAELEIPEADLRAYYDTHQEEFSTPERVRARQILLFRDDEERGEAGTRQLAQELKERAEAGEDFTALATEYSEDMESKQRGGDLGFFERGTYTPVFENAAFSVEPGSQQTIIGPIENNLGTRPVLHLVQVLQKDAGGVQPFESVENRIRVRLLNDRARLQAEERAEALAETLSSETVEGEEDLLALAEQEGVALEQPEPFALDENVPALGSRSQLAQVAFTLDPGEFGEAVRVPAGWAVPTVLEILEPTIPPLEEVRNEVRADLVTSRQDDLARERLAAAAERLAAGDATLDDVATELGIEPQQSGPFGAPGSIPGLGQAPEVARAALDSDIGEIDGPFPVTGGAVLFEVTDRQRFDPVAFADQKASIRERLESERFTQMLSSVVEQRRQDLEVSYSSAFIENFEVQTEPGA